MKNINFEQNHLKWRGVTMKLSKIKYSILALIMSTMVICSAPIETYAETLNEDSNTEDVADTQSENGTTSENGVSENIAATGDTTGGEIQMSGLPANNGLEIASTFPEELMPEGFHKSSCTYEEQTIEIAYMDKGNGEVVLAYLADSNGENGGFYMCDINTANMTDFVQIFSGEDKYIIVLDPGDVIIPPNGFTKANLQWYGKTVTAWILPNDAEPTDTTDTTTEAPTEEQETTVEQSKDDARKDQSYASALFYACAGAGKTLTVYAAQSESSDEIGEPLPESDTQAAEGSGIVEASPSEYFLVYAINQDGVIGFYMYDTKESTYQRYVAVSSGESQQITQYRSSAQKRLFVIATLAILLIICIFVLVNVILQLREYKDHYDDDDDNDDDHEMDEMRQRVAKKEKTHIKTGRRELNYLMDIDEDDDDEEEDEDDDKEDDATDWKRMEVKYDQPVKKNQNQRQVSNIPERKSVKSVDSESEVMRRKSSSNQSVNNAQKPEQRIERPTSKPVSRPRPQPELDDDFEFEFIDI